MCGTGAAAECNSQQPQQQQYFSGGSISNIQTEDSYLLHHPHFPTIASSSMELPPSFKAANRQLNLYAAHQNYQHHPSQHQEPSSLDSSPYSDLSSPPFTHHSDLFVNTINNSSSPHHPLPPQTPTTPSTPGSQTSSSGGGGHSPSHSPTGTSGQQQQRNPFIGRSACVVCGDRARGCNFGAITCASCKEFFRRNAFKMTASKLKCYFQNKCDINIYSRRFCAACRLSKCYQMGMKSEYIMSDAEKYERQLKIMERKLTSQSRRLALNVPLEDGGHFEATAEGTTSEYSAANPQTNDQPMDSTFQTAINSHKPLYQQQQQGTVLKRGEESNHILNSERIGPTGNSTAPFLPLAAVENTPQLPQIQLSGHHSHNTNHHHQQLFRSESEFKFSSSDSSDLPTWTSFGAQRDGGVSNHHLDTSFGGSDWLTSAAAPFLSPDRDAPFSWQTSNSLANHQTPPPPPPPGPSSSSLFELDEPESVKKLLRKVKVIRESGFYPTKFQLLVRAHSAEKSLSLSERCRLKYLTSVVQIMQAEIITDLPINSKCLDLMRIAETVTFCFIKMCKKLNAFQALSPEDQVGLVKGRVVETLILWSMMTINLEKECWEALDLERNIKFSLKMELLKEANKKLYEEHRRFAMSFDPEWRFNDNLMSLLLAISLYDADKSELSNTQAIRNEKAIYCSLLKKYISTLYEEAQVEETYTRLLNQLKLTEAISESHVKAYFDVSPNEMNRNGFGGLIMEIFDLNS